MAPNTAHVLLNVIHKCVFAFLLIVGAPLGLIDLISGVGFKRKFHFNELLTHLPSTHNLKIYIQVLISAILDLQNQSFKSRELWDKG